MWASHTPRTLPAYVGGANLAAPIWRRTRRGLGLVSWQTPLPLTTIGRGPVFGVDGPRSTALRDPVRVDYRKQTSRLSGTERKSCDHAARSELSFGRHA